jgi:endoglucanase
VVTDGGDIHGVMNPGGKPIHISNDAERTKVPGVEEFFVDLGMAPADVKKRVKVGDYVVLNQPFMETPLKIVSKALDNRMACFVAIEALRQMQRKGVKHASNIVVAFCTQEEVGLRGATTAANQVGADIGVGLDVNLACDTPGVPESQRVTKHGDGAAVMIQDSSRSVITRWFRKSVLLLRNTGSRINAPSFPAVDKTARPSNAPVGARAVLLSALELATSTPVQKCSTRQILKP